MLENGYPNRNAVSLNTQTNKIMPSGVSGDDGHATYVASILLGKTAQYTGVAPNATLFCGAAQYGAIEAIDLLVVDNDVNILTISIALGAYLNTETGEIYGVFNTYDFYAKYLDYISYTFGVSVCIASGNYGVPSSSVPSGLAEGAMSYNSITVGNIAVSGTYPNVTLALESSSSYMNSSKNLINQIYVHLVMALLHHIMLVVEQVRQLLLLQEYARYLWKQILVLLEDLLW